MHNELGRLQGAIAQKLGQILFLVSFLLCAWVAPAQNKSKLTPEQWNQDIDTLVKLLPLLHPNLYTISPVNDFMADIAKVKTNLAGKSDIQIALELQAAVAKAADAQTRLDFPELLMKERLIPLAISSWSDGLHVSATVKKFEQLIGAKLLKINNLEIEDALKKMGRFVARENAFTYQRDALSWFRFPAAFRMAGISTTDTLTLMVEEKNGKLATVKVYPIDPTLPANRNAMQPVVSQPQKPDLRWQSITGLFTQQWLPTDSVLYVQYNQCISREALLAMGDTDGAAKAPSFQTFSDSVFAFLAKTPYAKVLIDLRFNTGGRPNDGVMMAQRFAKLPKDRRPAKLFVATNVFTQGSAVEVAGCMTTLAGATLIGETSGTKPNHYDLVRQFYLPNSHIMVQYSSEYRPLQKGHGHLLTPKVVIPVTYAQYMNGRDPVLDYVREQ